MTFIPMMGLGKLLTTTLPIKLYIYENSPFSDNFFLSPHLYLFCVVSSSVNKFISCNLVIWATLGRWSHPGQQDTGFRLCLTLKI